MKKVRPMVDKDLRDYVLSKFDNKFSFNKSVRILLASQGDKIKAQAHKIINLEQSVDSLKSRNDVLSQVRQDFQATANRRLRESNEALKQEVAKLDNDNAELNRRLLSKERETSQQKHDIADLMKSIVSVKKEKAKLEKWSSDVSQHNASLMDEIVGDRWCSIERAKASLYLGIAIGLIVGLSIGHLFL